jgi:O-antigen ligase
MKATCSKTNRSFLFELPFWLSLSYWSISPDTITPKLVIASIPINAKDIVLFAVACFYLFRPAISNFSGTTIFRRHHWHHHLPILTAFLLFYAEVSMEGSGMDASNTKAMTYTLISAASAFWLGYILVTKTSPESLRFFLWRLTVYLAVLGLLYSAASFFSLQLGNVRADLNALNAARGEFGILRVSGPLFGASTGHFILVPALAFSIQELINTRTRSPFKFSVVMALTMTIVGFGSRAGLIILFLFFLCFLFFIKNKKQAIVSALIMVILFSIATVVVYANSNTDRLKSFEDSARSETYLTSLQIINNRSAELNFTGSGYGSYWSWYLPDLDEDRATSFDGTPSFLVRPFGYMLYHPHSTFLLFIVELGTIGLLYFLYLWIVLARLVLCNRQSATFTILNSGVFASGFSMFFDFFIFKGAQINTLWWIYLFGALALNFSLIRVKAETPVAHQI